MLSSSLSARRLAAILCALPALFCTSCVAVLPHTPQTDLVAEQGLDSVTAEFRKVTMRSMNPVVRSVEVDGDTVRLEVAPTVGPQWGWWGGAVVNQGVFSLYLPALDRAEVYENNKVFLYQNNNQRIMEILFGNAQDPTRFVDLLFSLKADQDAMSGDAEDMVEEAIEDVEEAVEDATDR